MGDDLHTLEIATVDQWVAQGADRLAEAVAASLAARSRCLLALSGGSTPGPVLAELATRDLDWERVTVLQVDERLAPLGHPDRNLTGLRDALGSLPVTWIPLPVDRILASVAGSDLERRGDGSDGPGQPAAPDPHDVAAAMESWTCRLVELADDPPVLDVVQLGLGLDGHTASLVPGDPALMEFRRYLTMTGIYQGYRRLTLTRPVLDRADRVVWLVRGPEKAAPLGRLLAGDLSIPAGVLRPRHSLIVADTDAARQA